MNVLRYQVAILANYLVKMSMLVGLTMGWRVIGAAGECLLLFVSYFILAEISFFRHSDEVVIPFSLYVINSTFSRIVW